ncbi:MAG: hypothetical protein GF315_07070 [candidate division Zixibacteria bacterium]|nr:hypothetical protein [candidate division Zixibacteria bacterium]
MSTPSKNCIDQSDIEFFYSIVHDLKTPVISIKGYANRLLKTSAQDLDETRLDYINQIISSASRIEVLIGDLLKDTKSSYAGCECNEVCTCKLILGIIQEVQCLANARRISFEIESELPNIICNENRIYQVFSNIIVNAVKFVCNVEDPRIRIGFENGEFFIEDNGPGIEKNDHDRIFQRFTRINAGGVDGIGIGLAITRKILDDIEGCVSLDSTPGVGTRFRIRFPNLSKGNQDRSTGYREKALKKLILKTTSEAEIKAI